MSQYEGPLSVLQRIRQSRPRVDDEAAGAAARCELCGQVISDDPVFERHGHLVDLAGRNLLCACRACYLLFCSDGAGGGHFRAVPDRYLALPELQLTPAQWESLQIPVGVAFFFMNSSLGRVAAFYPGPAGATESELPLDRWEELVAAHPPLAGLEPDVEAFLVKSDRDHQGAECFVLPIDACYELVGHLRRLWRGFDGGREAHQALESFFTRVRARAGAA